MISNLSEQHAMPSSAKGLSHASRKEAIVPKDRLTRLRNGVYHTDFTVDGKRIRQKLGIMNVELAEQMAQTMKDSMVGGEPEPSSTVFAMLKVGETGKLALGEEGFATIQVQWNIPELLKMLTSKKKFYLELKGEEVK